MTLHAAPERVILARRRCGSLADPVGTDILALTGPGRNWTTLWKPIIDAFGPVLGEDPLRPFHLRDDRIIRLGLHHVSSSIRYDVVIDAWWAER